MLYATRSGLIRLMSCLMFCSASQRSTRSLRVQPELWRIAEQPAEAERHFRAHGAVATQDLVDRLTGNSNRLSEASHRQPDDRLLQIPVGLNPHPELRRHLEQARQTKRRVGGNATAPLRFRALLKRVGLPQ